MDTLEVIAGPDNEERRLGLLLPDPTKVCAAPVFEDHELILEDKDIKALLTAPDRTPSSAIFDDHWVKEGDQKQFGSCNGWATASVFSKCRWLSGILDGLVFSGSYIYSWLNNGRDNGSALVDDIDELNHRGTVAASKCTASMIYRNATKKFDAEAQEHIGIRGYQIKTKQGFRTAVAKRYLVVVAVQVDGNQFANFKGNGIIRAFNGVGNHAIHVDDGLFFQGTEVYRAVNNWGLGWGNRGTALMTWDSFAQTFHTHQFWALSRNLRN